MDKYIHTLSLSLSLHCFLVFILWGMPLALVHTFERGEYNGRIEFETRDNVLWGAGG